MKKAILQSKWYFYLPIISIFLIKKQVNWVFEDGTLNHFRNFLLLFLFTFYHVFSVIFLLLKFNVLK